MPMEVFNFEIPMEVLFTHADPSGRRYTFISDEFGKISNFSIQGSFDRAQRVTINLEMSLKLVLHIGGHYYFYSYKKNCI